MKESDKFKYNISALTSTRLLARNSAFNAAGYAVPVLIALISIPIIIREMGTDRFGTLTLIWMVMGYFSLLDLGLCRALTRIIAEYLGKGDDASIPAIIWSALSLMLVMGLAAIPVVILLAPWFVHSVLKIPVELQRETIASLDILACSIPVVICTSGLAGVLESIQQFGKLSVCRLASGIFVYLSPLLVLSFSNSLAWVVGTLAMGRLILLIAHLALCFHSIPTLRRNMSVQLHFLKPMMVFGGWITISNIIDPLMTFLDRFMVGAMISMAAVAYYSTPYEMVTRMWIIPLAISGVVFPAFSSRINQDMRQITRFFDRAILGILVPLFLLILTVVFFAREGLSVWLGAEFAGQSALVLKLLAIGVFLNSVMRIPDILIKAADRPDLVSKYHLSEVFLYVPLLWWLVKTFGVAGAATAWLIRVIGETIYIFAMSRRFLDSPKVVGRHALWLAGIAILLLVLTFIPMGLSFRCIAFAVIALTSLALFWHRYLSSEDRALIKSHMGY
jgi:O-antigen/teichoic acid export membrane protein